MTLWVVPGGLAGAAASVEALSARLAAAHAAAGPVISAVVSPAADPVSLATAAGLSACATWPKRPNRAHNLAVVVDNHLVGAARANWVGLRL
ncbi:PE family protein [Mycobacterium simiae]|uniref:PE family protein n=1 Tax=Mycobacterium simiae TaxID=1784 RepID=A0A5B1BUG0_MYCSI|nr:PE family protein [Mycobacterium simiae]